MNNNILNMDVFVEDVTEEILQGNKDKVAELIQNVEGKTLQDITSQEIIQIVGCMKVLHSDLKKLQNQNKDLLKNLNIFYRANQEMAGIARDVSASVVGNNDKLERVMQIVQQYTTDTAVGFIKFSLDGEKFTSQGISYDKSFHGTKKDMCTLRRANMITLLTLMELIHIVFESWLFTLTGKILMCKRNAL